MSAALGKVSGLGSFYDTMDSQLEIFQDHVVALTGMPLDQALFLLSQLCSVPIAFVLRFVMTPSLVGETGRHLYCLFFGLLLNIVCFKWQVIQVLIPSFALYAFLKFYGKSAILGKAVLTASMVYLAANHIYRQYSDYGSYHLDITGPLMILTQKLSLLAWAFYDGQKPESEVTNEEHRKQRVLHLPSLLAYCSYLFGFMGFQTGPCYFYEDYITFIKGHNLVPYFSSKEESIQSSNSGIEVKKPSPNWMFFTNFLAACVCGAVVMKICPRYPIPQMADPTFIAETSFFYKILYCYVAALLYRFRYYFAWKLGESICYAGGFGFTGWSADGIEQWDLVKNCGMFKLETATSFKVVFDEWNKQTAKWLRFICYTRIADKNKATNAVFMLSAFWHGFYPGYYVTFGQGMLFVTIGRKIRKFLRPRFQTSAMLKAIYGVITFTGTHLGLSFAVTAMVLLRLSLVFKVYASMYFYVLIIAFVLMFCPIPKPPQPKPETANTTSAKSAQGQSSDPHSPGKPDGHSSPGGQSSDLRQRNQREKDSDGVEGDS